MPANTPNRRLATHPVRRRLRLQPHDARQRGTHPRRPERASGRAGGAGHRTVPWPHREDRGRRRDGRVRQRGRGGSFRGRAAAGHGGAQCRRAGRAAAGLPNRPASRRRHRLRRRCLRRHGQRRSPPAGCGRARRRRAVGRGLRAGARQARFAVPRSRQSLGEEHRPAGSHLCARSRRARRWCAGIARADATAADGGCHGDGRGAGSRGRGRRSVSLRPVLFGQTRPRHPCRRRPRRAFPWRCWCSRTRAAMPARIISPMG